MPRQSNLSAEAQLLTEPGDTARLLSAARAPLNLPRIDTRDPEQVRERIDMYFDFCVKNDLKPGVAGMANWLGVHRETLRRWKCGDYREDSRCGVVQAAINALEALWESYMQSGKINPVAGIFIGKNYFGLADRQDLAINTSKEERPQLTPQEIAERLPIEDEIDIDAMLD